MEKKIKTNLEIEFCFEFRNYFMKKKRLFKCSKNSGTQYAAYGTPSSFHVNMQVNTDFWIFLLLGGSAPYELCSPTLIQIPRPLTTNTFAVF